MDTERNMRVLHLGVTAGKNIKTPSSHPEEQRPRGKELSLAVGARQWLAQRWFYSP